MNLKHIMVLAGVVLSTSCSSSTDPVKTGSILDTKTYTQDGYTLIFKNTDKNFSTKTRTGMVNTFFIVYPKLAARFNPGTIKVVTFVIDTNYGGPAGTANGSVSYGAKYMDGNPQDTDIVTHEVMHIVQDYRGDNPGWLTEGIADYARYTYGVSNEGWSLQPKAAGQKYTDGYGVTGSFLLWIEKNIRPTIVDEMNAALHAEMYTDELWVTLTGKTVDDLWKDYYY